MSRTRRRQPRGRTVRNCMCSWCDMQFSDTERRKMIDAMDLELLVRPHERAATCDFTLGTDRA